MTPTAPTHPPALPWSRGAVFHAVVDGLDGSPGGTLRLQPSDDAELAPPSFGCWPRSVMAASSAMTSSNVLGGLARRAFWEGRVNRPGAMKSSAGAREGARTRQGAAIAAAAETR